MPGSCSRSLFIFRRDLRLEDNTGLRRALECSEEVIPCFIFDPRQIESHPFLSSHALHFMLNSLQELGAELKARGGHLFFFHGKPESILESLMPAFGIDGVFVNADYTPFSISRDDAVKETCRSLKVPFEASADILLNEPAAALKKDGTPYTVFTPFWKRASALPVALPSPLPAGSFFSGVIPDDSPDMLTDLQRTRPGSPFLKGGRKEALVLFSELAELPDYDTHHDFPAVSGTTRLSAHAKFGTVSIREIYAAVAGRLGSDSPILRQLYWRDFFTHTAFHFPHVFKGSYRSKYDSIEWQCSDEAFEAWCTGRTGFPIVDAGMRQLNETGFMHNRVRMITASFLVKDLHCNWRMGERYFAQHLIDYDPAVNNGNWQWAASTGCDAQPYFRIFNPWLQQRKYDPECSYVRKWCPELSRIPPARIHRLDTSRPDDLDYPGPIVNHAEAAAEAESMFAAAGDYE